MECRCELILCIKVVLPEPGTDIFSVRTTSGRLGSNDLPAMPTHTIAVGGVPAMLADPRNLALWQTPVVTCNRNCDWTTMSYVSDCSAETKNKSR